MILKSGEIIISPSIFACQDYWSGRWLMWKSCSIFKKPKLNLLLAINMWPRSTRESFIVLVCLSITAGSLAVA